MVLNITFLVIFVKQKSMVLNQKRPGWVSWLWQSAEMWSGGAASERLNPLDPTPTVPRTSAYSNELSRLNALGPPELG